MITVHLVLMVIALVALETERRWPKPQERLK